MESLRESAITGYRDAFQIVKWNLLAGLGILVFGIWLVIAAAAMGVGWGLTGSPIVGWLVGAAVFVTIPVVWGYAKGIRPR